MNTRLMHPVIETSELVTKRRENLQYINLEQIIERLSNVTNNINTVNAHQLAYVAGNPRTENIVILGAASNTMGFPLSRNQLISAIEKIVPQRTIEANVTAFSLDKKA